MPIKVVVYKHEFVKHELRNGTNGGCYKHDCAHDHAILIYIMRKHTEGEHHLDSYDISLTYVSPNKQFCHLTMLYAEPNSISSIACCHHSIHHLIYFKL